MNLVLRRPKHNISHKYEYKYTKTLNHIEAERILAIGFNLYHCLYNKITSTAQSR